MRTRLNKGRFRARAAWWVTGAGIALLGVLTPAAAQQSAPPGPQAPAEGGADAPAGLPPPNFPTSPHRGVIDGWGRPIPCRCRFDGKSYQLGEIICMNTHVGTVLTRCDIFGNNTSWMPSREPCVPKLGS